MMGNLSRCRPKLGATCFQTRLQFLGQTLAKNDITNNQHPEISAVKKIEVIINRCLISFQVANKCRIN
jgi:hypothetical protein